MRCFERLVESHFLADVSAELRLARQIIRSMSQFDFKPSLITDKRRKKAIYNQVVQGYGLLSEIKAGFDEADSDKDTIFYFHLNELIFIYSRNLKQVSEALLHSSFETFLIFLINNYR